MATDEPAAKKYPWHRQRCGCSACRPRRGSDRCMCGHPKGLHLSGRGERTIAIVDGSDEVECGCKAFREEAP